MRNCTISVISLIHERECCAFDPQNVCKAVELLKLAVFDRLALRVIDSIVVVEVNCFALEIFCGSWLIDAQYIPVIGLHIQYSFNFRVMVKRHMF